MSDKYCVLQDDLKDCGVCSLLSIIKYYHGDVSKEYLRELTKTTKDGVSALNILNASRELGFEAYGIKGKLKDLNKEKQPDYRNNEIKSYINTSLKYKKYNFNEVRKEIEDQTVKLCGDTGITNQPINLKVYIIHITIQIII